MDNDKKPLKKLRSTVFSRGVALSKMTLKTGALSAKKNIDKIFSSQTAESLKQKTITAQMKIVTEELGQLKGSIMKAGQQLSVYGEHFLPPEAMQALKSLQDSSPPVDWSVVSETLNKELDKDIIKSLNIDTTPIASASLGQVYKAEYKGQQIALKIQYPNLTEVIDADLKAIKRLLNLLSFIPKDGKYDPLFVEIKEMMLQELDYTKEALALKEICQYLKNDKQFIAPQPITEISTQKILAMSYEPSLRIDSPEVAALSQEQRNNLAIHFLELYFRELFEFNFVQTDPHLGNYGVRLSEGEEPKLVLYDYGAVKKVPSQFFNAYKKIIVGSIKQDRPTLLDGAMELGLVKERDPEKLVNKYIDLCYMFTEPFWSGDFPSESCPKGFDSLGNYNFGNSDLPKRIAKAGKEIVLSFNFRIPPKELVFLDRKMGGTFTFLASLKANINGRGIFDQIFTRHESKV